MITPHALCALGAADVSDWHGLLPLAPAELPACLEPTDHHGWLQFGQGYLEYRVWRLVSIGTTLWLFTADDGLIHLAEVFDLPSTIAVDPLLDQLGAPELRLDYPLTAQLQRPLRRPNEELPELVFGSRGLALLVGHSAAQVTRLARLRGFEVMPAPVYQERFVDLPDVRFFPEER